MAVSESRMTNDLRSPELVDETGSGAIAVADGFLSRSDSRLRHAFGVFYVQMEYSDGSLLWVTRHGWPYLSHLNPRSWFHGRQYATRGTRLTDGTGTVYRVSASGTGGGARIDLVVKFSRMAQEVRLHVASEFQGTIPLEAEEEAEFPSPFREFGLVEELRNRAASGGIQLLTKRPLAVFSPANRFEPRQMARTTDRFARQQRQLDRDQALPHEGVSHREVCEPALPTIALDIDRQYISIFQWIRGVDAEQLVRQGMLTVPEAAELVRAAARDLDACGFRMLDIKPSHIIVRVKPDGSLLRRCGRPVYALVDFELLQRT